MPMGVKEPVERRFWRYVDRKSYEECWEWTGARLKAGGYGALGGEKSGSIVRAHRFSYELHRGPIPDGMIVLHACDNPPCVNPHHLHLGTHADNVRDMDAKGRRRNAPRLGERHHKAKLSDSDVRTIRSRYRTGGVVMVRLAEEFGVSFTVIQRILCGKAWRHIT